MQFTIEADAVVADNRDLNVRNFESVEDAAAWLRVRAA